MECAAQTRPDERHVQRVRTEHQQSAVGKEESLQKEHERHTQYTEGCTEQTRGKESAEGMARQAASDRIVQHLKGEDGATDKRKP